MNGPSPGRHPTTTATGIVPITTPPRRMCAIVGRRSTKVRAL
jgi:hypothetical protein